MDFTAKTNVTHKISLLRWLLMENKDPTGQLQWLIDTLAAAEATGEIVHIIGHIPPGGGDCDHTWSHVFNQIISRCVSSNFCQ